MRDLSFKNPTKYGTIEVACNYMKFFSHLEYEAGSFVTQIETSFYRLRVLVFMH